MKSLVIKSKLNKFFIQRGYRASLWKTNEAPTKIPLKPQATRFLTDKSDFSHRKTLVQEGFAESGLVVANWAELNTKERGAEDI